MVVKMPPLSKGVDSCTVSFWHVFVGDRVEKDDDLVEMETGKAVFNVPSPCRGILVKILVSEGDTVKSGDPICVIE